MFKSTSLEKGTIKMFFLKWAIPSPWEPPRVDWFGVTFATQMIRIVLKYE